MRFITLSPEPAWSARHPAWEAAELASLRLNIRNCRSTDETELLGRLVRTAGLSPTEREEIVGRATGFVEAVRSAAGVALMEGFLSEYGLSTNEGMALMSLAEALLRVPDRMTERLLIGDKLTGADWAAHEGQSQLPLVNLMTRGLDLGASILGPAQLGLLRSMHGLVQRLGEPVIGGAIRRAMTLLGGQFVFGRTIEEAIQKARKLQREGHRFSFDMLGEAARTARDAARYKQAYGEAIDTLAPHCRRGAVNANFGISIKLSALHPRYEFAQRRRVMSELVPAILELAHRARAADMGFNIDAEEADRLDLSLDVIAAVLADPGLARWNGFGIVVQAYGKRAIAVIDWLAAVAKNLDQKLMIRLVKGAYWDTEIKRAQVLGLDDFPVLTRKAATDVSYIAAARRLLEHGDTIYPQFATHNAHTAAAVLHLAKALGRSAETFEFQRLHGMGEQLHDVLRHEAGTASRIYAPIGPHKDLLAYLVRRLLENGANGSFVHRIADKRIPTREVTTDPFSKVLALRGDQAGSAVVKPDRLFAPARVNSRGRDLTDPVTIGELAAEMAKFQGHQWAAAPILARTGPVAPSRPVINPAKMGDIVGTVANATPQDVEAALSAAAEGAAAWSSVPTTERAACLRGASTLFEENATEFYALLCREAGKVLADCVSEVREAVDFLRYYAAEAEGRSAAVAPRGVFACISPWNFPLAIFTGQIAAALAAGNAVLAKPAEATPLVAALAVRLMHEAGIPPAALQLLPGAGGVVGSAITSDPRVAGVCFTGSLATAQAINRTMARNLAVDAPLIAETGGINAMIVDSTALPEQAVRDIVVSAFQSAGQRCSALRILYVQEDTEGPLLEMLKGAMDELSVGDPWCLNHDVGPIIDETSRRRISDYVDHCRTDGRVLYETAVAAEGYMFSPTLIAIDGIEAIPEEIFGPVLHVATFAAAALDSVIESINNAGYGLTFCLHTRIDARTRDLADRIRAGNIYVNRNQIGAVVGSQPFGGEGLSGTGPKAGGPRYLQRFGTSRSSPSPSSPPRTLPGPTGEINILSVHPRGTVLCLGPSDADLLAQESVAGAAGNRIRRKPDEYLLGDLEFDDDLHAVLYFGKDEGARVARQALSRRAGAIVPLITSVEDIGLLWVERHVCIDATAAGGNASLMTQSAEGD
ncbi:MAG: bifunctional proline dehydrogenase/L-glutamate gamma-semialdehyde dehydrogenase PutA [Devosia sp.]